MLGAYLELTGAVRRSSIVKAFKKVFGSKAATLLSKNQKALERGVECVRSQIPLTAAI